MDKGQVEVGKGWALSLSLSLCAIFRTPPLKPSSCCPYTATWDTRGVPTSLLVFPLSFYTFPRISPGFPSFRTNLLHFSLFPLLFPKFISNFTHFPPFSPNFLVFPHFSLIAPIFFFCFQPIYPLLPYLPQSSPNITLIFPTFPNSTWFCSYLLLFPLFPLEFHPLPFQISFFYLICHYPPNTLLIYKEKTYILPNFP